MIPAAPGTYMLFTNGPRLVVGWRDDGEPVIASGEVELTCAVIPATEGSFVLQMHCNEDGPWSSRIPIVGWSIKEQTWRNENGRWSKYHTVEPVAQDDTAAWQFGSTAILRPDGTVDEDIHQEWKSENEWFNENAASAKEDYAKEKARRAAAVKEPA